MMTSSRLFASMALVGIAAGACRPVPEGDPVYPVFEEFRPEEFLDGPNPFVEGEERLSLNVFYEGDASEALDFGGNGAMTDLFDYVVNQDANPLVFTAQTGVNRRDFIEGLTSASITVLDAGVAWWGVGVVNEGVPYDLTGWTTMRVSFKATDDLFEGTTIQVEDSSGAATVNIADPMYGDFASDGEWHSLVIPLEDFGLDFSSIRVPFSLLAGNSTDGSVLLVDDLYWTKE